ncbi:PREDICTED: transcription factor LHW-like [Tarenaya hassleriana]|uniref:transcription factor LHW-like n=1 Tax=Tarenaya hassleriana TaxID=28532 RepID=UPI00053CA94F|nr:PREDICTED: transcription factor LHW-like [Tarenaya hassleriana]XP_010557443.1 PREDICTED: transcription factor LHW-like [Tarenaya hassleriana]
MGVLLREALRTVCVNNQWSYAVFWKIGCQNASLLIWEECYHETTVSSLPPRISGFSPSHVSTRGSEKIPLLTNRMMLNSRIVLVGEGLVGRAAFAGHHQWILANRFNRDVHPPEVINEMLLQFSAGIQTVAVVPVLPHGIVQLGSSLPIMESLGFVNDVKRLILQLGCVPGALLSETYRTEEGSADLIGVPVSRIIPSQEHNVLTETSRQHFNSSEPNLRGYLVDEREIRSRPSEEWENTSCILAGGVVSSNPDMWLNGMFSSTFDTGVEQQILPYPPGTRENDNMTKECSVIEVCGDIISKNSPGSGSDLFDILGLDHKKKGFDDGWSVSQIDGPNTKTEMGSGIFSGYEVSGTDHLLDAVVSGACSSSKQISDDTSESCRTTLTKVSNCSVNTRAKNSFHGDFSEILKTEKKHGSGNDHSLGGCSQTTSIYGSQISSWVEQSHGWEHQGSVSKGYSRMNKNENPKPANRKRLKPGENPRPRPKDRQMIQDRVKELREIIPNGAKCSIDALLERTIKHMLFLQNVTKHTDKLKQQTGESTKMTKEGGATWAFEVGTQSLICPIVVEDLNPPRCFQVEMLCEQRGFFLEIADWIRSLGVTILKGAMETRNDKIWARFAVEANRDVTRMEMFMQLVNVFEQRMKCVGGATNNTLDGINDSMPMNGLSQTALTGGCSV